ncbi:MAG: polysaccharide biosynthesis protein [Candidatus Eremiobacteraeota bacterium]|nr:polysaccharide biosynthesis protein [Candidatus Eremiobacteraeota bacterium]
MQVYRQWPIYFIGRILPAAIAFGAIGLYTRLVDPSSFGTYALLLSTSYLISLSGFSWLRMATIRMMATVSDEDLPDFTATIAVSFAGISVLVAAILIATVHICNPSLPLSLAFLTAAAAIASNWFELNIALMQARMKLITYGVLQAARAFATLGATVLLVFAGFKAAALLGGFAIGNCTGFGIPGAWSAGWRGRFRRSIFMKFVRFGWPSSASSLAFSIVTVQRYLLAIVGGSAAVGVFAVASDFTNQSIGLLMGTVTIAGQPLAFRARDRGAAAQLDEQLRNNARLLFGVGFAAAAGVIALAGPLAHVFFGEKFRDGAQAIVAISAVSMLIGGMRANYFEQAFEIVLETRPLAFLTALRIVATIVPSFFLIHRFGAIGASVSMVLAEIVSIGASVVWGRRLIRMPVPFGSFAQIAGATLAMVAVIQLVPNRSSPLGLALAIAAGVTTYVGLFALVHFRKLWSVVRLPRVVSGAVTRS